MLPAPLALGCTGRFSALMMPLVTVPARPRGEPKATTGSPTRTPAELPSVSTGRLGTYCGLITAMSEYGSAPTSFAGSVRPPSKITRRAACVTWPSRVTTWLLVTM